MCFMTPKAPPPVTLPEAPPAAEQPAPATQESDPSVQGAQQKQKQARLKAAAGNNTLVTGGLTAPASTGTKQLYGQ